MFPKTFRINPWLWLGLLGGIVWWVLRVVLAARWTLPGADSVMYALPLGGARHPFDLGVPFLDDFEGYGRAWGHQWPGALWLRGLFFMLLPFSRVADLALLIALQGLAAALAGLSVWRLTARAWPAAFSALLVLSDRVLMGGVETHRLEVVALLCLALLAYDFCRAETSGRARNFLALLSTGFAPTLHPYSLALGGLFVGGEVLADLAAQGRLSVRVWSRGAAFLAGCAALVAWFALQPAAWEQFHTNVALQKTFALHWNTVWAGLSNYRLGAGYLLWIGAALAAVAAWFFPGGEDRVCWAQRLVFPAWFFGVGLLQTGTRCENFYYLALASVPAAVLLGCASARFNSAWGRVALAGLTLLHASILPYRLVGYWRAGCPDLSAEVAAVIQQVPAGRTIFVPPTCWDVALRDSRHRYRFWTFAIASDRERRVRYEAKAYAKAKPGDVLIVDRFMAASGDKFGVLPTFSLLPPDPAQWQSWHEQVHIFAGKVPWGIDLALYEHR